MSGDEPGVEEPDKRAFGLQALADRELLTLAVHGDLDLATAPLLGERLRAAVADGHDVVLDLRDVRFIDSSGVAVLLNALRRQTRARRRLVLVTSRESPVRHVLQITGVTSDFTLTESVRDARRAVAS
jgi:anti-anti-sigma factor